MLHMCYTYVYIYIYIYILVRVLDEGRNLIAVLLQEFAPVLLHPEPDVTLLPRKWQFWKSTNEIGTPGTR